jgi:hypothetical protein
VTQYERPAGAPPQHAPPPQQVRDALHSGGGQRSRRLPHADARIACSRPRQAYGGGGGGGYGGGGGGGYGQARQRCFSRAARLNNPNPCTRTCAPA